MNRFESSDTSKRPPESIRSEIEQTRQQMNSTIDALTERLKGRHLLDEIVGLFRSNQNGNGRELKEKVSQGASTAVNAIVDTVKAHPLPVLAVGAGLAWLLWEKRERDHRDEFPDYEGEPDDLAYPSALSYPATGESGPGETFAYTSIEQEEYGTASPDDTMVGMDTGGESAGQGAMERLRDKARDLKDRVRQKTDEFKERARIQRDELQNRLHAQTGDWRERAQAKIRDARQRAAGMTTDLRYRTRDLASRTRMRVSQTSQEHPLETGLACLALGLLSGLLTPAPRRLEDKVGPAGVRLRERVRETGEDLVRRGKQVAQAAADAAKGEARAQGLTPDAMREKLHEATAPSGSGSGASMNEPAPAGSTGPAIADQPDSPEGFRSPSSPPATPPPPAV